MERIRMALVGCGGMGQRHLYGLRELTQTPFCNVEVAALCDIRRENAEMAADEAEKLLGVRPPIFTDMEKMVRRTPDLVAADVVTDPAVHHAVVCQALDLGLHVLVEKPLGITVGTCRQMMECAQRNGRILSVAENFRRDPSARLVHHLLETGVLGPPYLALFHHLSGGNTIFITPWRHLKEKGGLVLDLGVHFTDMIRYQLGEIAEVYADVRLLEPVRYKPKQLSSPYPFYQARFQDMEETVPATAEDFSVGLLRLESGVMVDWMVGSGGTGGSGREAIFGEKGVIEGFGTRGGRVRVQLTGQEEMDFEQVLEWAPDFPLEPLAEHLFPNRKGAGDPAVDWKLLALEHFELGEAILKGREIEVDGSEGLKDVAALYALFESAHAGRAVTMDEVESGQVYGYQAEIDHALGVA